VTARLDRLARSTRDLLNTLAAVGYAALVLPLVLQIGPVQIEPVTPRLLRVRPGSDQPAVLDAIRRASGSLDGTRRFFWVDAFKLRQLEAELRASADLFGSP
jgi:hypothetical protein